MYNQTNEFDITFHFKRPNIIIVYLVSVLLILIIGITDYISGFEMSFSIFYLIPISFSTFMGNIRIGLFISLLSAITWYSADLLSAHIYTNMVIPVWNAAMRFGYFAIHTIFLAKLLDLYNRSRQNALTDHLTQIPNWRLFKEISDKELKKARRTHLPLTLVYLDLDNFKKLNDTEGHSAGDQLLIMVAKEMNEQIRPSDTVARLGGDEFAILLPETTSENSDEILHRLNKTILKKIKSNNWPVTLSIGAVTFKSFDLSIDEMLKLADNLMYEVKHSGKKGIKHVSFPE
jgi:diguanylate cyclase (GGDEF)-like protein